MASKTQLKSREKGSGSVYRDGKRWYLKIRINGKTKTSLLRNPDGTPCTKKVEATAAADGYRMILLANSKEELITQVAIAKKLKRQSGLKLSEAWDTYLKQPNRPDSGENTLKQYQGQLNLFINWLHQNAPGVVRVADVNEEIANDYFSHLWSTGVSARTYNAYLQSLRLIFKHLIAPAALDNNPFDGLVHKTNETISRSEFTPEQVVAIFDGFKNGFFYETEVEELTTDRQRHRIKQRREYKPMHADEMRVLLNLCCWTGCRGQDGCLMTWGNVDLINNRIAYIPRKTARKTRGKGVFLPLHPDLKAALSDALQWRGKNNDGEDYILPAVAHRYLSNQSGVQKDVMKIIRLATGLETTAKASRDRRKLAANAYSLHSFRHSFVSFCANSGVPLAVVAEIVGHGNPAMTRHYSHITTAAKAEAIAALPELKQIDSAKCNENERRAKLITVIEHLSLDKLEQVIKFIQEHGNEI